MPQPVRLESAGVSCARSEMRPILMVFAVGVASASSLAVAGWTRVRRSDPDTLVAYTVALAQPSEGVAAVVDALLRSSDPASAAFGRHATKTDVDALTAASPDTVAAATAWLASAGIAAPALSSCGGVLRGTAPIRALEQLLGAPYHKFARDAGGRGTIHRAPNATVPLTMRPFVDWVGPSSRVPPKHGGSTAQGQAAGRALQASGTTPTALRALYGVGTARSRPGSPTQQCVSGFDETAGDADLARFFAQYWPTSNNTLTHIGPNDQGHIGGEANLDSQYVMSMGAGVNTTFWNAGDASFGEFFLAYASLPDAVIPKVVSTSYNDHEDTVDPAYAARTNADLAKLTARGVTVVFSSGDKGPACANGRFSPDFPAGSPYVTAVGGTDGKAPTEACASFSGGGFSDLFPAPSWQLQAVASFKAAAGARLPLARYWNQTGAGLPVRVGAHVELAAQGWGGWGRQRTDGKAGERRVRMLFARDLLASRMIAYRPHPHVIHARRYTVSWPTGCLCCKHRLSK